MKKLFTLVASALFCAGLVSAAEPATSIVVDNTADSYLDCGINSAYSTNTEMTLEAWVKYPESNGGYLICNESDEPGAGASGYVLRSNGGVFELCIGNGNWSSVRALTTIQADGTWHHIAATIASTETKMYVDGVLEGTNPITTPMIFSAQPLRIAEGTAWTGRRMSGQIADVRIWALVRSEEEILAKMGAGALTGTEPGLIANWKMNEGTGSTIADAVAGGTPLTMPASVTWDGVINSMKKTDANVNVLSSGKSFSIENNSASALNVAVYNLAGAKVLVATVKAGQTFAKSLASGAYIMKGVTADGSTVNKKVVLN